MKSVVVLGGIGLLAAAVTAWPGRALAYPQWQLSSGATRCNQCHFAPGGGGLPNGYGRMENGDELSTFEGDGLLLHGKARLPSWLALGADLRGAIVSQDVQDPSGPTLAAFPMQADAEARVAVGAFSLYVTAGLRGQVRSDSDTMVPSQSFQPVSTSELISREHWLMWQPDPVGYYARAGRFFAPFGLRLAEHLTYIRRDLGFNQLEESYNLSGGYISDQWEAHVTAFAPDFVRHIGSDESGVAGYYERRFLQQTGAWGAQIKVATGPGMTRYITGGVGKYYLGLLRTLFLAELDLVHMSFDGGSRDQLVGAAGLSTFPTKGVMVTLLEELNQEDLAVRDAGRTATTALLGWFPYPHCELQIMGRLDFPMGQPATKTLFTQAHYFF